MKAFFKTRGLYFLALLLVLSACKKDRKSKPVDPTVIVKYVITTNPQIASEPNRRSNDNWIVFSGNAGEENVERTLKGTEWVKEIKLKNTQSGRELGFTAQLYLQGETGVVNGKIYVNGELKGETKQTADHGVYGICITETKLIYNLP